MLLLVALMTDNTRDEQRLEKAFVSTAPVCTLVMWARTRVLAYEQTLGPLFPLDVKTVFIILNFFIPIFI
jgi:hypothetical protein